MHSFMKKCLDRTSKKFQFCDSKNQGSTVFECSLSNDSAPGMM